MPLFLVAVTEPDLIIAGALVRGEQIILPPTPLMAANGESAKIQGVLLASQRIQSTSTQTGVASQRIQSTSIQTDEKRWEVHARPFV